MTYLCVPIFVSDYPQAQRDAVLAAEAGADMVEFRIDEFTDAERVTGIAACSPVPAIVTCRSPSEGGRFDGTEAQRIESINAASGGTAAYIDVELETYRRPNNGLKPLTRLILSAHDFK